MRVSKTRRIVPFSDAVASRVPSSVSARHLRTFRTMIWRRERAVLGRVGRDPCPVQRQRQTSAPCPILETFCGLEAETKVRIWP